MALGAMGPKILYRNVHIGLREGQKPGLIVSYYVSLVPCACLGPSVNKPLFAPLFSFCVRGFSRHIVYIGIICFVLRSSNTIIAPLAAAMREENIANPKE